MLESSIVVKKESFLDFEWKVNFKDLVEKKRIFGPLLFGGDYLWRMLICQDEGKHLNLMFYINDQQPIVGSTDFDPVLVRFSGRIYLYAYCKADFSSHEIFCER